MPTAPRKPAVPSTVEVGATRLTIEVNDQRCDDGDVYGFYDHDDRRIVLSTKITADLQRETLLHECLHALLDTIGVSKGGAAALLDKDAEERLVHPLAAWLMALLRRNPDLVAYLVAP